MSAVKREHLGSVAAANALLEDLYLDLRAKIARWSEVTRQTPQPRMGYVGQHLVSVVTGCPGGRSGARGHDLVGPSLGRFSEIKTCYRVDQLGKCNRCQTAVSSIELTCPACGCNAIDRKDDSKWLITPKHDQDMKVIFDPEFYYLVLFDFVDLADPRRIRARIWRVDPRSIGFASILVDYYFNIRTHSKSRAPFNLWPFRLKFQLMEPLLIYSSVIDERNSITTLVFPGRDDPQPTKLDALTTFAKSGNLEARVARALAEGLGVDGSGTKAEVLARVEAHRASLALPNATLVTALCVALYRDRIGSWAQWLPHDVQDLFRPNGVDR